MAGIMQFGRSLFNFSKSIVASTLKCNQNQHCLSSVFSRLILYSSHSSLLFHHLSSKIPFSKPNNIVQWSAANINSHNIQIVRWLWPHVFMPKKRSEDALLYIIHKSKPRIRHKRRHPLDNRPQMKGVVLRTLIKKPKKPNSANRKCVRVRLSNGKEIIAHVPGEGHNLQEHNVVLLQYGRTKDVPGLRVKVIRGKYDCAHVVKKNTPIRT